MTKQKQVNHQYGNEICRKVQGVRTKEQVKSESSSKHKLDGLINLKHKSKYY